jgi:hypothetical protein
MKIDAAEVLWGRVWSDRLRWRVTPADCGRNAAPAKMFWVAVRPLASVCHWMERIQKQDVREVTAEGGSHATRRQIKLYGQAETTGRTHRRRHEQRGVSEDEAERRAWATVNKETPGGEKSGSGRGKEEDRSSSRKGGQLGGEVSARRPAKERSASAKKAARTRKRHAA